VNFIHPNTFLKSDSYVISSNIALLMHCTGIGQPSSAPASIRWNQSLV
jgi:hypothetical protein